MAGRNESNRSITNVAALANVSIATVSRVLSGKRTKDDDIARRVRAAAEQLDYSVNYAASALRSTITNTIGLIIPSATETFSAQLLDEIEPTIDVDSQQLLLGIGADQEAQGERMASLVARHVDGLIVVPAAGADLTEVLERYAGTLPIVQVGGRQRSFHTSMVGLDENAAMEMVIGHLADQGIESVAYMAGKEISFESAELFAMFHTQVRAHHLRTQPDWNRFGERSVQRGFDCAMRLFSEPLVQPEAVVCADDTIAFGMMVALHALGLRVPQDVLIVGYNDSPIASTTMPTLTSVRPPFQQIVSEALRLIALGPERPAHISLPPRLIIRDSTVVSNGSR
jgi:LacI family transcriptional regulator